MGGAAVPVVLKGPWEPDTIKPTKSFRMCSTCDPVKSATSLFRCTPSTVRIVDNCQVRLWQQSVERDVSGIKCDSESWRSIAGVPFPTSGQQEQDLRPQYFSTICQLFTRNHLRLVVGGGGDLTTSIFLLEGVDFMLNIDVYSRFDPDRDPAVMAMMRMMREGGIGSDTGDISVQSYLYGDAGWFGCFGLNGAAYCGIRVWWGWWLGFECLEQKFTWTLIRSQVKSIFAILMSSWSLKLFFFWKLCQVSYYVL